MATQGQPTSKKSQATGFNPIKEDIGNKRAQVIQWTTNILNTAVAGLSKGKRLVANPFYENNVKLLKPNMVFVRTKEEVDNLIKIAAL